MLHCSTNCINKNGDGIKEQESDWWCSRAVSDLSEGRMDEVSLGLGHYPSSVY